MLLTEDLPKIEPLAPPPSIASTEASPPRTPPRIDISELPAPAPDRPSYTSELPMAPGEAPPSLVVAPADESQQAEAVLGERAASVIATAPAGTSVTATTVSPGSVLGHEEALEPAPVTSTSHSLRLPGLDGGGPSGELSFDPRVHTARIVTERADAVVASARRSPWRVYAAVALALVAVGVAVELKVAARGEGAGSDAVVSAFRAGMRATQGACEATLTIEGIPLGAELFRRMGSAPLDVPRMPVGARLEWVAIAEGHRVRRAVVAAGVPWNHGQGARYELAIQLDPSAGRGAEPWPSAEPGPQVGGAGSPGLVHIVTTPPGAEIFLFSGVSPEATLGALPCGESFELLLAGPRDERRRVVVGSNEFVNTSDGSSGTEKRAARVRLDQR